MCVSDPLTDPNFLPDPKLLVENYLNTLFLPFNVVIKILIRSKRRILHYIYPLNAFISYADLLIMC